MNRIINELFNRAGGRTEICDVTGDEILTYNEYLDPKKFAELIVRECAEICLEANDHKNILQHFGVEE
jgi:hypothetical protein